MRFWLPVVLLAAGSLRIAGTWQVLTQTFDESFHIACGVEWWDAKKDTREQQHPPLARIAVGALPYWSGVRDSPNRIHTEAGNEELGTGPDYFRRLMLARAGTLPFYLLFCVSVWRWARMRHGEAAGLGALFLASQMPPILGHGALATTDMAAAATLAFALWRFDAWLAGGTLYGAVLGGVAAGLALSSKMSNLALLPLLIAVVWLFRRTVPRYWWRHLLLGAVLALLVLLSVYRFRKEIALEAGAQKRSVAARVWRLRAFLLPYVTGLEEVIQHNEEGAISYLFGYTNTKGDWRFFPVAFFFKTPVPVLILLLLALRLRAVWWACCLFLCVMLAVLPSHINLGLRHALALYIGVSIAGGLALAELWRTRRWAAALLGGWLCWNSVAAHPDYLAWFNEFAGGRPERILAESDLDWGQDLHRTLAAMDRRGIGTCKLAYFGTADWKKLAPGRFEEFWWNGGATGCVAVSVRNLSIEAAWNVQHGREAPFVWLERYQPVERVGQSMRLYQIAGPAH